MLNKEEKYDKFVEEHIISEYADLLYNQALLIEGFTIDDPIAFSNQICNLMVKANN